MARIALYMSSRTSDRTMECHALRANLTPNPAYEFSEVRDSMVTLSSFFFLTISRIMILYWPNRHGPEVSGMKFTRMSSPFHSSST